MIPTDESLREAVRQALAAEPGLAARSLRVGVLKAVVHLAGEAPSEALWRLAGSVAAAVPGVRGVVNRIHAPGVPMPSRVVDLSGEEGGRVD